MRGPEQFRTGVIVGFVIILGVTHSPTMQLEQLDMLTYAVPRLPTWWGDYPEY